MNDSQHKTLETLKYHEIAQAQASVTHAMLAAQLQLSAMAGQLNAEVMRLAHEMFVKLYDTNGNVITRILTFGAAARPQAAWAQEAALSFTAQVVAICNATATTSILPADMQERILSSVKPPLQIEGPAQVIEGVFTKDHAKKVGG